MKQILVNQRRSIFRFLFILILTSSLYRINAQASTISDPAHIFNKLNTDSPTLPSKANQIQSTGFFIETTKLFASDASSNDNFASSIVSDGNTLLVGVPFDDDYGSNSGSAYIFEYNPISQAWFEVAKLTASDAGIEDWFGTAVALSGDLAFISAPINPPGGMVYVFERNEGGLNAWGEIRQIKGEDTTWADYFGISMDISNDLLVVGAYAGGDYDGSAYVFERDQGGPGYWGQVGKLTPADNPAYNYFGYSVAIDENSVLVGAPGNNGVIGAAYIFQRNEINPFDWLEIKKLFPPDGAPQDFFGLACDINDNLALVGSPGHQNSAGAAYLFARDAGNPNNWGQVKQFIASDGSEGDGYGASVTIAQDIGFVGAPGKDLNSGAVYHYALDNGGFNDWVEKSVFVASDGAPGDSFGSAVARSDDGLISGAPGDDPGGSVYIYTEFMSPDELTLKLDSQTIDEASQVTLSGTFSDSDAGESHRIDILWGDGISETWLNPSGSLILTATHHYMDDIPSGTSSDPYLITVSVMDPISGSVSSGITLTVNNITPVIYPCQDASVVVGTPFQQTGGFTDPGSDIWIGLINYGVGDDDIPLPIPDQTFYMEHLYSVPGIYTITVTIADDDLGVTMDQILVTVLEKRYMVFIPTLFRD